MRQRRPWSWCSILFALVICATASAPLRPTHIALAAEASIPDSDVVRARNCGTAWVFRKIDGAVWAGHVAWGISTPEMTPHVMWGSVDGPQDPSKRNWKKKSWIFRSDSIDSMLENMRSRGYDDYAFKTLNSCDVWGAVDTSDSVSVGTYELFGRNCANATFDVLTAFGIPLDEIADIPNDPAPNFWFNSLVDDFYWSHRNL